MIIKPEISVIITTKNSGADLYTTMDSLVNNSLDCSYEVIIVDEESIDGCCNFLITHEYPQLYRVATARGGVSARHLGTTLARGKYLLFCSSRLYFQKNWINRMLEPLRRGEATAVSPLFSIEDKRPGQRTPKHLSGILHTIQSYPWTQAGNGLPWLWGECYAILQSEYEKFGGLRNGFYSKELETAEFSLRVWLSGGICQLVPDVKLIQVMRNNYPVDKSINMWEEDLVTLARMHFHEDRISLCEEMEMEMECAVSSEEPLTNEPAELDQPDTAARMYDEEWFFNRFGIYL